MDTTVTINVTANDRDRDGRIVRRTVRIVGAGPRHGRAGKQRNGTVIYTPDTGFSGQDTFRYRVKDNRGALSNRARVQVTVLAGTRPPVANDDTAATAIDTPVVINVVANDTDADGNLDPRSVAIATNPASGGLVNRFDGTVTYTPSTGFFGTDAFTYTVRDGRGATSNVATVTVTVNAGPVADGRPGSKRRDRSTRDPEWVGVVRSRRQYARVLLAVLEHTADQRTGRRRHREPREPGPQLHAGCGRGLRVGAQGHRWQSVRHGRRRHHRRRDGPRAAQRRRRPGSERRGLDRRHAEWKRQQRSRRRPGPLTFSGLSRTALGQHADHAITGATTAQPFFTPDLTGLYRLTLTVSDGALSGSDDVNINVTPVNVPPNANAGPDVVVQLGPPPQPPRSTAAPAMIQTISPIPR